MPRIVTFFFVISIILLQMRSVATSTVLLLKDGGTLEGELLNPDEISQKSYRIKTAEGLEITLDAQIVDKIQKQESEALIEYNRDAPLSGNTVENHLFWAKWCTDRQLPEQAKTHWQQILEIDPDHTDARAILGYRQTPTGWEHPRDKLERRGLIQYQGRWRTHYEIEVENILENNKNEADFWKRTISTLYRRLPNPQAETELLSIRNPAAFVPIRDILVRELNPQRRIMLLRLLLQIPDARALQLVAGWAIRPDEPSENIRKMCVEELLNRVKDQPEIRVHMISVYRSTLRANADPKVINLAAQVLGEIGGYEAVPELIEVLQTTRIETIQAPVPTYSMGPGRSGFGQGGGPTTRVVSVDNQTVQAALRRLTGKDFGFDRAAWQNWYRQFQRSPSFNLRNM